MANKIQIKKYLENKKNEAIAKLRKESEQLQEEAKNKFFNTHREEFERLRQEVIKVASEYDALVKKIHEQGTAKFENRYSSPNYAFNELCDKLSISNLSKYYVVVSDASRIIGKYEEKIEDTKKEYNNLIAVCGANTAKDCIKILENLGFDTSEIEPKKEECTTLITNIDASKLFV